ncbi:MAG: hypothetical protein H7Y08_02215 [Rhizobiaceae bacterium]|nr:hypothetical protein [Rhizobiaceae bacterium]
MARCIKGAGCLRFGVEMMMFQFVVIPYSIGFSLLALLPGWRSLIAGSLGAVALSGWAFGDVGSMDSPAVIVALPMVGFASLGLFAGGLARAATLLGRARRWRLSHPLLVLPLVFVAVPALFLALAFWQNKAQEARLAPPSPECTARLHDAMIADVSLAIPLAPAIDVSLGQGYDPTFVFRINQHAREFCSSASAGVPSITRISIDVGGRVPRGPAGRNEAVCSQRRPFAWWQALCRESDTSDGAKYLEAVNVYVLGRFDARVLLAMSAEITDWERSEMAAITPQRAGDGLLTYVGAHNIFFTRADVPGYLARCYRMSQVDDLADLYCSVGYPLTAELGLVYRFRTREISFDRTARQADSSARAIFESLRKR